MQEQASFLINYPQLQILELGKHLGVVQLELDHPFVKTFLFGQVFPELG